MPAYLEFQAAVATNQEKVGRSCWRWAISRRALAALENSLAFRKQLAERRRPTTGTGNATSPSPTTRVGDVRYAMKDFAGALADYQAGRAVTQTLADAEPQQPERLRDLMIGQTLTGDACWRWAISAGALADYEAAARTRETHRRGQSRQCRLPAGPVDQLTPRSATSASPWAIAGAAARPSPQRCESRETLAAGDPDNALWQRDLIIGALQPGASRRPDAQGRICWSMRAGRLPSALKAGGSPALAFEARP